MRASEEICLQWCQKLSQACGQSKLLREESGRGWGLSRSKAVCRRLSAVGCPGFNPSRRAETGRAFSDSHSLVIKRPYS